MKIQHSIHNPRLLAAGFLLAAMTLAVSSSARADDTTAPNTDAPDTTAPSTTAPGAATPGTPPPGTYIWTWKYTKGQVLRAKVTTNISGKVPGSELVMRITATEVDKQTVRDVAENGDVTIDQTVESSQMTAGGETHDVTRPPSTTTVVIDKKGTLKSYTSDAPTGGKTLDAVTVMMVSNPLPDHPVKLGESWTAEIDNRLEPGTKVTVTSTLQRIVDVNGVDVLKIHSKMSIPRPKEDVEIKVDGNYNVDREKGQIVSATATIDNVELPVTGEQALPVHIEVNQSNVPDAVTPQGGPQPQPQPAQEDVTAE